MQIGTLAIDGLAYKNSDCAYIEFLARNTANKSAKRAYAWDPDSLLNVVNLLYPDNIDFYILPGYNNLCEDRQTRIGTRIKTKY